MIPARLGSSRLPRKPLRSLAGRPLIEWVWRRASALDEVDELVVAADDDEIVRAVERFGGRAVLTRTDHRSGTDRVAEVAGRAEFGFAAVIVNLQGDEPFLPRGAVAGAVGRVREGWPIGTVAVPIAEEGEWRDPGSVKVVCDDRGGALYFSRAPIPASREGRPRFEAQGSRVYLRHVGIYAFAREALERAARTPIHALEEAEGLEQLRWLAAGLKIGVGIVTGGHRGIDTEDDLVRAEELLNRRQDFP